MGPLEYAARIAYSSREVLQFSFEMGKKYKDIPNTCMLESGVAAGAQIIALMAGSECKVPIYALDSFEGLPLASNKDNQAPGLYYFTKTEQMALPNPGEQVLVSSGATVVSEYDFWQHIDTAFGQKKHNVKTVKGWFEITLPTFECPPISVLRLDGDLYNSTYVCLKYLYPKLIKGGVCIIDDWALPGCRQAVMDWSEHNPLYVMGIKLQFIEDENYKVCYWTK